MIPDSFDAIVEEAVRLAVEGEIIRCREIRILASIHGFPAVLRDGGSEGLAVAAIREGWSADEMAAECLRLSRY